MSARTVLVDLRIKPTEVTDLTRRALLKSKAINVLKSYFEKVESVTELNEADGFFVLLTGPQSSVISLRGYVDGTLTLNVEFYRKSKQGLLDYETAQILEKQLSEALEASRSTAIVPLKRGGTFERYFITADERLLEYDVDELLFEERSPYQKVQIFHSKSLGNMLVLDDNQNMSEADLVYTETLMQRAKENYEGKEIVILGGGDGGLLWELLKENPKHVTMLEIDEVVINACSKYMKTVCGDCLDKRKDSNYEIILGDCFKTLNKMIGDQVQVDYVFGDLTEVPINSEPCGMEWNFIRLILNYSMNILKPGGKFMTHGNSAALSDSLKIYEDELSKLSAPVTYTKDSAFIPSFYEQWVFYQITKETNVLSC